MTTEIKSPTISVEEAFDIYKRGELAQFIDVREPSEFASMHIARSICAPLSNIEIALGSVSKDAPLYLICQSGARARKAAERLTSRGITNIYIVAGGLNAWLSAGYPVERAKTAVWAMDRQVRLTAGSLILLGLGLGYAINTSWLCLSVFVAIGMIFSAVTDSCGMATLLSLMPWNKSSGKK